MSIASKFKTLFHSEVPKGPTAQETMAQRYASLCAQRDEVNAKIAPIQARLDAANADVATAQKRASDAAAEIQRVRGGQKWLDLKKEIGLLAMALNGRKK